MKMILTLHDFLKHPSKIRLDGFKVLGTGAAKVVYSEGDREIRARQKDFPFLS